MPLFTVIVSVVIISSVINFFSVFACVCLFQVTALEERMHVVNRASRNYLC